MNKDTKKGVILGIFITIAFIIFANSAMICFRTYIKKEINHETKAKTIMKIMDREYAGELDKADIYEGMYTGMVALSTDRYSRYISAEDYESFKISSEGNYVGIGVKTTIDPEDYSIYIYSVYEDSPAAEAGLMTGDKIIRVNETSVSYDNYNDAIDMIRGEEGSSVKLSIKRGDNVFDKDVMRKAVDVPTVGGTLIDDDIGYIEIDGFEGVTFDQYTEIYNKLKNEGMKALVLDLRDNPGGLLSSVSDIADAIIPEGVITYTEDKEGNREYVYSKEGEADIPIAVIVNENSASAAELLTAAIKDTGKGTIVGKTTYGKGVVQTTFPLTDGSAVKLTTSKYYTPNGVCIDGEGVKPDVEVSSDSYVHKSLTSSNVECDIENDAQLKRAVEILRK